MRVAVIGAGAAGLVTARELLRAGLEPVVLEQQRSVGGTWRYQAETEPDLLGRDVKDGRVHSSMYASLRTNLPTRLMAFSDFPFGDAPTARADGLWFCHHHHVQAYLEQFAEQFDLTPWIRFGVRVTGLAPRSQDAPWTGDAPPDAWRLGLRGEGNANVEEIVDAVAICTGHYTVPRVPRLPGPFEGVMSHSHNYRDPAPFRGLRVAILGARSSGTDLSQEIATVAEAVHLCAREHDGHRSLGPRLLAEPSIAGLGPGRRIQLVDGRVIDGIDHLLFCTGYRYAFPGLSDPRLFECDGDWVGPLHLDLVSPSAPNLALVGLPFAIVPFPLFEAQARWWACMLSGVLPRPTREDMLAEATARTNEMKKAEIPRRQWLRYGDRQFDYVDDLRARAGAPPLPAWYAPLYRATRDAKRRDPAGYRDAAWSPIAKSHRS